MWAFLSFYRYILFKKSDTTYIIYFTNSPPNQFLPMMSFLLVRSDFAFKNTFIQRNENISWITFFWDISHLKGGTVWSICTISGSLDISKIIWGIRFQEFEMMNNHISLEIWYRQDLFIIFLAMNILEEGIHPSFGLFQTRFKPISVQHEGAEIQTK